MAPPTLYEGTVDEIVAQIRAGNLTGRYRAIIAPCMPSNVEPESGPTLLERLQGRIGRFDFGDANLSVDTGRKYAALLAEDHAKGQE